MTVSHRGLTVMCPGTVRRGTVPGEPDCRRPLQPAIDRRITSRGRRFTPGRVVRADDRCAPPVDIELIARAWARYWKILRGILMDISLKQNNRHYMHQHDTFPFYFIVYLGYQKLVIFIL